MWLFVGDDVYCGSVTLGDKQPFRLFVNTLAPLRYLSLRLGHDSVLTAI